MSVAVPIDEALGDGQLLGAALGPLAPWSTWLAALKAAFGIRLTRQERRTFTSIAGDRKPPREQVRELWALVGRRGGKSRMAAAVATVIATCIDHSGKLAPGETGYVLVLSATTAQAKAVFSYCQAFLEQSPVLRQEIVSVTSEEIRLRGNIVIAVHTNSFRSVRGRTLLACVFDEVAFWRDDSGANPDIEVLRATIPALMTTRGMLVGISSPYRKVGLLFARHRDFFGKDNPEVLIVQGATTLFNPTISKGKIDRAVSDDPEGSMAEWQAEFRNDLSALLDDAMIEAAIDNGRPLELPPRDDVKYYSFADASAGKHDAFCFGIGHREGEKDNAKFVADVIRGRRPPFDPKSVAAEYASLAREYRCGKVFGDAFAGEWVSSAFRDAGVAYEKCELPKSALYLEGLPQFTRGSVSMPDIPILTRELRLLERRTHRSGKDSVDHGRNGSDDFANVLFGAMWLAMKREVKRPTAAFGTYGPIGSPEGVKDANGNWLALPSPRYRERKSWSKLTPWKHPFDD